MAVPAMRARARMVSWMISEGQRVNGLSGPWPMLLYTWLIPHADNLGRFHGEPEQIKALVLPRRRDVTAEMVESWLLELSMANLIYWYEVAGMRYLQFPDKDWARHQKLSGNMRRSSDLPKCPDSVRTAYEHSTDAVSPEVEVEGEVEGEEEREREVEGEGEVRRGRGPLPPAPAIASKPVRTRTVNQDRIDPLRLGDRVRIPEHGIVGTIESMSERALTIRVDHSADRHAGELLPALRSAVARI